MSTAAPYSSTWRLHTRARMFRHGITAHRIGERTGLGKLAELALLDADADVSLEVAGPIDELLDALDDGREASMSSRANRTTPTRIEVGPVVDANIDALLGKTVHLRGIP